MRVTTSQLRMFVRILDEGGLTNAARSVGMTQPALSSALARFEREVGVKVFDRGPSGLVPTRIGRALEGPARRALADSAALHELAEGLSGGARGRISVALSQAAPHLLPITTAIRRFRDDHPDAQVRLCFHPDPAAVVRAVDRGEANLGIAPRSMVTPTLDRVELPVQRFELALPGNRARRVRFADVQLDGVLPFMQTVGLPAEVPQWLQERGLLIEVAVVDALPGMVVWMLEQGVGAAMLPTSLTPLVTAAGGWSVPLPDDFPPLGEDAALVFHRHLRSPLLTDFLDIAVSVSTSQPDARR